MSNNVKVNVADSDCKAPKYDTLLEDIYRHPQHNVRFVIYSAFKRAVDFVLALILAILLLPTFVVIAILIKIDSPGPVLFRQERVGKNGRIFKILKFRTMSKNNEDPKFRKDKYTKIGKKLRRLSLDEIPQLFNVIAGEMSFVGPRPWVTDYWTNMSAEEKVRGKVRPGITGLAQVKGRNGLTIFEKIEYDLIYVRNFSLWQDIKILAMTVVVVFGGKDVDAGKGGIRNDIKDLKSSR